MLYFELGLVYLKTATQLSDTTLFSRAQEYFMLSAEEATNSQNQKNALLWASRCALLLDDDDGLEFQRVICSFVNYMSYPTRNELLQSDFMYGLSESKVALSKMPILQLDGVCLALSKNSWPVVVEQRTMLPIREFAENIGATVEWKRDSQEIIIKRGSTKLTLEVGQVVGQNKKDQFTMDVPPFAQNGRTFSPARFICEQLNQDVVWVQDANVIKISEKKTEKQKQMESWELAMGAMQEFPEGRISPVLYGRAPRTAQYTLQCRPLPNRVHLWLHRL